MRQLRLDHVFSWASSFFIFFTLVGCESRKTFRVRTETIKIDSLDQIVPVTDPQVRPLLYINVSGLEKLPVREAKAKFISAILPSVLVAKHTIAQQRKSIEQLRNKPEWESADSSFYLDTKNRYKAKDIEDLVIRMVTLPNSIVLARFA